jgi:hypothetical protein
MYTRTLAPPREPQAVYLTCQMKQTRFTRHSLRNNILFATASHTVLLPLMRTPLPLVDAAVRFTALHSRTEQHAAAAV